MWTRGRAREREKVVGDKAHGNELKQRSLLLQERIESQTGVRFTIIPLKHVAPTTTKFDLSLIFNYGRYMSLIQYLSQSVFSTFTISNLSIRNKKMNLIGPKKDEFNFNWTINGKQKMITFVVQKIFKQLVTQKLRSSFLMQLYKYFT